MAAWPPKDPKKNKNSDKNEVEEKKGELAILLQEMSNSGGGHKLQTRIDELQPEIQKLEKHKPAEDHTKDALVGHGASAKTDGSYDQVTGLSVADKILMLKENNIHVSAGTGGRDLGAGTMAALVVRSGLERADRRAVQFQAVELQTPTTVRYDNSSITYGEFESNLQRHTVTDSDLSIGIPGIFQVDGAYSNSSSISAYQKKVKVYFQSSQLISKVKVVFDRISLAPEFVAKITEVCGSGTDAEKADKLLSCLNDYGHFVPTSVMVGGRITLHTSKELNDRSDFESTAEQFKLAAEATLRASGSPPVNAGGKAGRGKSQTSTVTTAEQTASLRLVLKGGIESMASSHAATLGTDWIPTLGRSIAWRTIGYNDASLVPIIKLLSDRLRTECERILRAYFVSNLDLKETELLGPTGGDPYPEQDDKSRAIDFARVRRIVDVTMNSGFNLDGLQWTYDRFNDDGTTTRMETGRYIGAHNGDERGMPITLKDNEVITAVVGGWDSHTDRGMLRRLAFVTNRGRYPNAQGTYYGEGNVNNYRTIEAPRVRGMCGFKQKFVQSIGLKYLALANNARSREYLLAMEPYLFPDHNYGIVT